MPKFKITPLDGHTAEVKMELPIPGALPCDLEGDEATKRIAKWVCSYVVGLAGTVGLDMGGLLYKVQKHVNENIDAMAILARVRSGAFGPYDIESDPPEGMTGKEARIMVQKLLDRGLLFLDDDLHLAVNQN